MKTAGKPTPVDAEVAARSWQAWGMSHLIDTTEMFLKVIYELNEYGRVATRARIGERLGQAAPSVSQTIARMERDGLLVLESDKRISLTPLGSGMATAVMRKHRLAERLLHEVLGLAWANCHDEACEWEHVISDEAEVAIARKLSDVERDPYGNPIPKVGHESRIPDNWVPVSDGAPAGAVLVAIGEIAQASPGLLHTIWDAGIRIGESIVVTIEGDALHMRAAALPVNVALPAEAARNIFVTQP